MMYEDEIVDVIDDLYNKDKFISPKSLSKVFYILKDKYNINDYVDLLLFDKEHPDSKLMSAGYDNVGKYIMVYKNNFNYLIKSLLYESELDDKTTKVFINFILIGIIIHEMTHVRQLKYLLESNDFDYKYELFRHCLIDDFVQNSWNKDYLKRYYGMDVKKYYGNKYDKYFEEIKKYNKKYYDLYDYDPVELQAEYIGRSEVLHISKYFKSDIASIVSHNLDEMRIEFINYIYKVNRFRIISPSEIFRFKYNNIIKMDKIKKEEIYNFSLKLFDRVALGLPITHEEYYKVTKI